MSMEKLLSTPLAHDNNVLLYFDDAASSSNSSSETVCGVCGEKTKIKHFGAYSCLSCKAFFRRSIWNSRIYFCEGNEDCVLTQEDRYGCRACRLAKCLKIGMNPKMLWSSQMKTAKKQKNPLPSETSLVHNPCVDRSQIDALVLFDRHVFNRTDPPTRTLGRYMIAEAIELPFLTAFRHPSLVHRRTEILSSVNRVATVNDILDDLNRKFVLYADWLNELPDFLMLPEHVQACLYRFQIALAKAGFPQYNLNVNAWRTFHIGCSGVCLVNGSLYPLDPQIQCVPDPKGVVPLFMHSLVDVLKSLEVDETEYILLKIINVFAEAEKESNLVREKRDKYIGLLTRYVLSKHPRLAEVDAACRVGELMLLLASITNLAYLINDTVEYWDTMRFVRMGELMCEAHRHPSALSSSDSIEPSTSQVPSK